MHRWLFLKEKEKEEKKRAMIADRGGMPFPLPAKAWVLVWERYPLLSPCTTAL